MKLGPMLMIGPCDIYDIEYRTRLPESRKTVGICCYDTERILLKRGQSPDELLDTVLHETLHAITAVYADEMRRKKIELSHALIYFLADKLSWILANNFGVELKES